MVTYAMPIRQVVGVVVTRHELYDPLQLSKGPGRLLINHCAEAKPCLLAMQAPPPSAEFAGHKHLHCVQLNRVISVPSPPP